MASATTDTVLTAINSHESFKNIWTIDSGASCHYCNSDEDLFDQTTIFEMIIVGNRNTMKSEKFGKHRNYVFL
jgi:hypothetical protein